MSSSHELNRRDFVKIVMTFLGTVMTSIVGIPAIGYLISPAIKNQKSDAWIPIGTLDKYPIGIPTLFTFTRSKINGWEKTVNSFGVYVVKTGETQAKVYSNLCTHLSCRVSWKEDVKQFACPCHDGHFDAQGKVVSGPPPRPLDDYETKIENGALLIHLKEG